MAGYHEYSKSNNALEAEGNGRFPATVLASRLGVKPGAIRALLSSSEWHHTSKRFNLTDYYDEAEALEVIEQLRAWQEPAKDVVAYENCSGSYLVWTGTRNHPHAREIKFQGIRVTKKGKWYALELPEGALRKGESTNGFHLRDDRAGKWLVY